MCLGIYVGVSVGIYVGVSVGIYAGVSVGLYAGVGACRVQTPHLIHPHARN